MLFRPLDENGDMTPVRSARQMLSGAAAVGHAADARVAMMLGEWWEDTALGFHLYDILITSARAGNVQMLENYISAYLALTQECAGVTGVKSNVTGHDMTYGCTLITSSGDSTTLEVTQDGLYSALY